MSKPKPFVDPALQGADYGMALAKVMEARIPFSELEVGAIYRCVIDRVTDNGRARYEGNGWFNYEVPPSPRRGEMNWGTASAQDASLDAMSALVYPIKKTTGKKLRGE